jgi:hypothetical protein
VRALGVMHTKSQGMEFRKDDLSDLRISDFLEEHIQDMKSVSLPES